MSTFIAFIDLQKDFDCVNGDLMLKTILENGIDSTVFLGIKGAIRVSINM